MNQELCLDTKTHSDVLNIKKFIMALEDIAEMEQERQFELEKTGLKEEIKVDPEKPASPGSSPVK